jgi:AraC-like DNA-binding protein
VGSRNFRAIRFGVETMASGDVPRHLHREGYANVILSGTFTEASFAGRSRVFPGVVLLHGAFDCHANIEGASGGPTILRLPWRNQAEGAYLVRDADELVKLCEKDLWAAECALQEMLEPVDLCDSSWVDGLAFDLGNERVLELRNWAEERRLNPASVSRAFRTAYGVSPQRFRLEARTRRAWRRVVDESAALTQIAHECSFADLSHMTRSVAALTGAGPKVWRTAYRRPSASAPVLRPSSGEARSSGRSRSS